MILGVPALVLLAYLLERFVLLRLFARFDRIREYMFLLSIAWCLAMARLAGYVGLTEEIGAFVAGVAIASSPISLYIAESLKPVRDFFLVLFFFSVGASFNLQYFYVIIWPSLILAVLMVVVKPLLYSLLLRKVGENSEVSWEVGARLGQISEFSLIIAAMALDGGLVNQTAAYLIQATTMMTFMVSCYYVVAKFPTPVAMTDALRRD